MVEKYLEKRKKFLNDIVKTNKSKHDHNQIQIVEANNQIKELQNVVDEASGIFSIKAREDKTFNSQEVNDLEIKITALVSENKDILKKVNAAEKELETVEKCIQEIKELDVSRETSKLEKINDINVSRETLDEQSKVIYEIKPLEKRLDNRDEKLTNINKDKGITAKNVGEKELISKLKFCKDIALSDGKRVVIELDNIIKNM